jgi:hypothetical protein
VVSVAVEPVLPVALGMHRAGPLSWEGRYRYPAGHVPWVGGIDPATVGVVWVVRVLDVELVPVLPTPTPPEPEPDPPVAVVIGPPGLTVAEDELDVVVELED